MSKIVKEVAFLIIGNEILSGRTKDVNMESAISMLAEVGYYISEVRIVKDIEADIIAAVNDLRMKYNMVFTGGGIGPTHDDITAESIAKAFGVRYEINTEAYDILKKYYEETDREFNETRMKMAKMPAGSKLILNSISAAPGFIIENAYVMAGVPKIFKDMLTYCISTFAEKGEIIISKSLHTDLLEGVIGEVMSDIQAKFHDVEIGSYPYMNGDRSYSVEIVLRSTNQETLDKCLEELRVGIQNLK